MKGTDRTPQSNTPGFLFLERGRWARPFSIGRWEWTSPTQNPCNGKARRGNKTPAGPLNTDTGFVDGIMLSTRSSSPWFRVLLSTIHLTQRPMCTYVQPTWKELKDSRLLRPTLPSTPESDQQYASKNRNKKPLKTKALVYHYTNLKALKLVINLTDLITEGNRMQGLKPMREQRQGVWMQAQSAEAHPWVPSTGHSVDGLWEGKRALREQGIYGRLKQTVPSSPTPSSASRTTPSAHTVPSWKACTPSVPLKLRVLWHFTPTGSNWPSPPTSPLHPFAKKKKGTP